VLKPQGTAIFTVPAFQLLWGLQDELAHHKRRYVLGDFRKRITQCCMNCDEIFYFNYLLFVPIFLARQLIRVLRIRLDSEGQVNSPLINRVLTGIFAFDVWAARKARVPFGVSICAVVRPRTD
jgi:hypothetical protein